MRVAFKFWDRDFSITKEANYPLTMYSENSTLVLTTFTRIFWKNKKAPTLFQVDAYKYTGS